MPLRGLLLDLEGVLYEGGRTIAGAAEVVGKPSPIFFEMALRDMGL